MEDTTQEKLARSATRPAALVAHYGGATTAATLLAAEGDGARAPYGNTANAEPAEAEAQPSRQKRREMLRKIDKARAAISVEGEARNQAVLEKKRKMGQVKPPRSARRHADATFKRRK